jgi:hypothetical protein
MGSKCKKRDAYFVVPVNPTIERKVYIAPYLYPLGIGIWTLWVACQEPGGT